ncbi:hypothetical protein [Prochlorococcus marinus]|uniref:hypothetical protein n=1 Tax=Prochlorococcus marinus TaxID=1219 RepID=UPI001F1EB130|nr:hypothetical protein [Prochlorococcus marinus]
MSFFDSLRYPGNEVQGAAHHHAYPGEHARHFVFRNTRFKVLRNTMLSLPRRRRTKVYSKVIRNTLVNRSSAELFFIEPLAVRLTSC